MYCPEIGKIVIIIKTLFGPCWESFVSFLLALFFTYRFWLGPYSKEKLDHYFPNMDKTILSTSINYSITILSFFRLPLNSAEYRAVLSDFANIHVWKCTA